MKVNNNNNKNQQQNKDKQTKRKGKKNSFVQVSSTLPARSLPSLSLMQQDETVISALTGLYQLTECPLHRNTKTYTRTENNSKMLTWSQKSRSFERPKIVILRGLRVQTVHENVDATPRS